MKPEFKLKPMEEKIVKLLCRGFQIKEIAAKFNKTPGSVHIMMVRCKQRLACISTEELVFKCGVKFGKGFIKDANSTKTKTEP